MENGRTIAPLDGRTYGKPSEKEGYGTGLCTRQPFPTQIVKIHPKVLQTYSNDRKHTSWAIQNAPERFYSVFWRFYSAPGGSDNAPGGSGRNYSAPGG